MFWNASSCSTILTQKPLVYMKWWKKIFCSLVLLYKKVCQTLKNYEKMAATSKIWMKCCPKLFKLLLLLKFSVRAGQIPKQTGETTTGWLSWRDFLSYWCWNRIFLNFKVWEILHVWKMKTSSANTFISAFKNNDFIDLQIQYLSKSSKESIFIKIT